MFVLMLWRFPASSQPIHHRTLKQMTIERPQTHMIRRPIPILHPRELLSKRRVLPTARTDTVPTRVAETVAASVARTISARVACTITIPATVASDPCTIRTSSASRPRPRIRIRDGNIRRKRLHRRPRRVTLVALIDFLLLLPFPLSLFVPPSATLAMRRPCG